MKITKKTALTAVIAALIVVAPASAHRMWMLPSTFTLSGDEQWITIDGAISNDLYFPNHVALPLGDINITAPDGTVTQPENGWTGKIRSTFDLKLDQQGTWKISETGRMYFAMYQEDGEIQRTRGSWQKFESEGILDKPGVKLMQSARKVETYVTLGAPTDITPASDVSGITFAPITHPNDAYAGEAVTFGYTVNGQSAEGLEVEIILGNDRYRDTQDSLKLTTNADGQFTFTPERPGRYWVATQTEGSVTVNNRKLRKTDGHVLTFEVLAP